MEFLELVWEREEFAFFMAFCTAIGGCLIRLCKTHNPGDFFEPIFNGAIVLLSNGVFIVAACFAVFGLLRMLSR